MFFQALHRLIRKPDICEHQYQSGVVFLVLQVSDRGRHVTSPNLPKWYQVQPVNLFARDLEDRCPELWTTLDMPM